MSGAAEFRLHECSVPIVYGKPTRLRFFGDTISTGRRQVRTGLFSGS